MTFNFFMQNLVNALQWGSFYALIALGYSMVYSILMLFNFSVIKYGYCSNIVPKCFFYSVFCIFFWFWLRIVMDSPFTTIIASARFCT